MTQTINENFELLKKYLANEIMKFEPVKKGPINEIKQLENFINELLNDNFQGILCLYTRAIGLKRQCEEYERVKNELKQKIPELII